MANNKYNSLQIENGSSGYSSPGPSGTKGDCGKSAHFSSIPIDSSVIIDRITHNNSLTNNDKCIEDEIFQDGDVIVDLYGDFGILKINDSSVNIETYGNIVYNNYQEDQDNNYHAPTNSNEKSELDLIVNKIPNLYSTNHYVYHYNIDNLSTVAHSKLWNHRWNTTGDERAPAFEINVSDSSLYYMEEEITCKEFVRKICIEEKYCKFVVLFKNGLSYEIPLNALNKNNYKFYIFRGYFDMFPKSVTDSSYGSFNDERNCYAGDTQYKFITGEGKKPKLCDIYFEYSHDGKTYRMNCNVRSSQ